MAHDKSLTLPFLVVGPSDVSRLQRELEGLNDYLHQASLRGGEAPKLPRTSRMLDELAGANELNLLEASDREHLTTYLDEVAAKAPVVTMSFASDPSSAFTVKIVSWLRQNIDPNLLLKIGLQPNLAAGCTLRTVNRFYDLSLKRSFNDQKHLLIESIQTAGSKK